MRHERFIPGDPPSYRDGEGAGYRKHSEASKDGARAANPKRPTKCDQYFALIEARERQGMTADEIAGVSGDEEYLIRPRLTDLKNAGRVVETGERRMGNRKIRNTVWIAKRFASQPDSGQGDLFEQAV